MKNVLVVDDEIDILESIVDNLELEFDDHDIVIEHASNGQTALEKIDEEGKSFDLVITDINMPEMNGLELSEKIRDRDKQVWIIAFSGHGDLEEEEVLDPFGNISMVKKPDIDALVAEVTKRILPTA